MRSAGSFLSFSGVFAFAAASPLSHGTQGKKIRPSHRQATVLRRKSSKTISSKEMPQVLPHGEKTGSNDDERRDNGRQELLTNRFTASPLNVKNTFVRRDGKDDDDTDDDTDSDKSDKDIVRRNGKDDGTDDDTDTDKSDTDKDSDRD